MVAGMNTEKLDDYLDYLHIQEVKQKEAHKPRKSLAQVKQEIGVDE